MADEIDQFLLRLGLTKYTALFAENEITTAALKHLTEDDLKELGLPMGPRKILLAAIAETGHSGPPLAEFVPRPPPASEPELRQLTVMFCDLVDSTVLTQILDPEDLRDVLRNYHDAVAAALTNYGGYLAKHLGDGVLAYFGWPRADEAQAESAIRAGLEAARAVEKLAIGHDLSLKARVGIATGRVVVGDLVGELSSDPDTVTGETPNLAARLQHLADPGGVIIDTATQSLIGDAFELQDLGAHALKGFPAPVPAWNVIAEGNVVSRFEAAHPGNLAPFVGRGHELGLIEECWDLAKNGEGQVVILSGEPGIGKSRLVQMFCDTIADEPHHTFSYQCSPYHQNSAFFPVIQHIKHMAEFTSSENADTRLNKLETMLEGFDAQVPLFAALLSLPYEARYGLMNLSPQQIRERTLDGLTSMILSQSLVNPVLILLEDAHWIDPTTELLISEAVLRITSARVLILITHRPSYKAPWTSFANHALIYLNRISKEQCEMIVGALGGEQLPEDVVSQIIERSDRVPLFVEELTKSILQSGAFNDIPTSLQASLIARIDHLADAKKVAQIASVIGRPFDEDFIHSVGELEPADLSGALSDMVEAGLLLKTGTPHHSTYRFKHSLIQEVTYQSLLRNTRKHYHSKVAEAILQSDSEADDHQALIAWHYSKAERPDLAVDYWQKAGLDAGRKSAHREAIANLESALEDLARLPHSADRDQREFNIRIALGASRLTAEGWSAPAVAQNYQRARQLSENAGDPRQLFVALRGLANVFFLNGKVAETRKVVDRLIAIAKDEDDTALLLESYRSAGMCALFAGQFGNARELLEQANALYDRSKHHELAYIYGTDPSVVGQVSLGWANWFLGEPGKARANSDAALTLAAELKHPFSLAYAQCLSASLFQFCRRPEAVRDHADAAIATAEDHHYPYWLGWATVMRGWAVAALGEPDQGILLMQAGLQTYESTGARQIRPYILSLLAEMHGWAGTPEVGLRQLDSVIGAENDSDVDFYRSEAFRVAAILSRHALPDRTAGYRDSALQIARQQGAPLLELRILTDLLSAGKDGDHQADLERLRALAGRFDADLDDPDLADARRIIQQG